MEITDFLGGAGACMLVCVCMCVCVCVWAGVCGFKVQWRIYQKVGHSSSMKSSLSTTSASYTPMDEPVQVGFDGVVPFHMQVQSLLSVRCLLLAVRDLLVEGSRDTRARRR